VANLAPGALRKEGTHFDLPIALGILAGDGCIDGDRLDGWVSIGELALDGSVRPVRGTLPAAIACRSARRRGLICPAANAAEAALVSGVEVVPVSRLTECLDYLSGAWRPPPVHGAPPAPRLSVDDMVEVRGQPPAKRALEIAAAGGHNLLNMGSLLRHLLSGCTVPPWLKGYLQF
jgi:magnesium chelatase family protein